MNTRVLLFPLAVAVVATVDACTGITATDPSIRRCHDDTTTFLTVDPNGDTIRGVLIQHDDTTRCRKAA